MDLALSLSHDEWGRIALSSKKSAVTLRNVPFMLDLLS